MKSKNAREYLRTHKGFTGYDIMERAVELAESELSPRIEELFYLCMEYF